MTTRHEYLLVDTGQFTVLPIKLIYNIYGTYVKQQRPLGQKQNQVAQLDVPTYVLCYFV